MLAKTRHSTLLPAGVFLRVGVGTAPWRVRVGYVSRIEAVKLPVFDVCIDIVHYIVEGCLVADDVFMETWLPFEWDTAFVCFSFYSAFKLADDDGEAAVMMEVLVGNGIVAFRTETTDIAFCSQNSILVTFCG